MLSNGFLRCMSVEEGEKGVRFGTRGHSWGDWNFGDAEQGRGGGEGGCGVIGWKQTEAGKKGERDISLNEKNILLYPRGEIRGVRTNDALQFRETILLREWLCVLRYWVSVITEIFGGTEWHVRWKRMFSWVLSLTFYFTRGRSNLNLKLNLNLNLKKWISARSNLC